MSTRRGRFLRLAIVVFVVLAVGIYFAATAVGPRRARSGDAATDEAQFLALLNRERTNHHVAPLPVDPRLGSIARGWSEHMATQGQISHNPNLRSQMPPGWTAAGENVGEGGSVEQIQQAFVNSPEHEANEVSPGWTQVGIGVGYAGDGRIYVTEDFATYPPPPAPPPAPAPRTPPPPASVPARPPPTPCRSG